ncbi:hypothetical protein AB1N83_005030 [Pleurotus pulmonarius]
MASFPAGDVEISSMGASWRTFGLADRWDARQLKIAGPPATKVDKRAGGCQLVSSTHWPTTAQATDGIVSRNGSLSLIHSLAQSDARAHYGIRYYERPESWRDIALVSGRVDLASNGNARGFQVPTTRTHRTRSEAVEGRVRRRSQ